MEAANNAALEIVKSLEVMNGTPFVGFDCEWVKESKVALMQIAVAFNYSPRCYLFRLCEFEIASADALVKLLNSERYVKLGVGIMGDIARQSSA